MRTLKFPTYISEPLLQWGNTFQKGWGMLTVTSKSLIVKGRGRPSVGSSVLVGGAIAQATAGERGLRIPYDRILDVIATKKQITLDFVDDKGKERAIYLRPFRSRGLFGGKDPQAEKLSGLIEELRAEQAPD